MTDRPIEPTAVPGGFSPYVLFRRGTLAHTALAGTVPERTWAVLADAERVAADRDVLRDRLDDALHRAVPTVPAEYRGAVLRLRRDVHNDRAPAELPAGVSLPAECWDLVARWVTAHRAGLALLAEAESTFAAELDTGRKALAELATDENFQRGVQLSGEDVYREVMSFAADPFDPRRKPSRRRRMESTITSFAHRVVFKPSPFGSFTEIGARPFDGPVHRAGGRVASTRLSVGLLAWMAHQLGRIDGAPDLLHVRLNNSLVVRGDRVRFARRPIEGADDGFDADRVIDARHTDLVRLLRDALGTGGRSERELTRRLVAAGLDDAAAGGTIDQLVRIGLVHRGLGLPDQTVRAAGTIAERLRALDNQQALDCADVFDRLQDIEDEYAGATAARRTDLLADLRAQLRRFVEVCGCPPPDKQAMRAAMYEDVGTGADAASWRPDLLHRNAEHLALWQRVLPVLDDATIEKLGLYRFFVRCFGEDATGIGVLDLYREFAALTPHEAGALMSGVDDPHADRVRALRAEFFDLLRAQLADRPAEDELRLDPELLRDFADRLPSVLPPWRSAAYRMQMAAGDLAVVNGITTGYGVFFSRFCDLLTPAHTGGWDLADAVRGHIARTTPRQVDITAVLGLNFNLHPRLTPYELVYPGSVPRQDASRVLTLAELTVRADPATRRLTLVSTVDGQPIDLAPLNFLYPAAAPPLYRFLCAFAPTRTYRGGLWEQLDRTAPAGTVPGRPRVLLGDLVLDRRSWRFPVAELPALDGVERQDLAALAEFDRWRRANGLPRHGFFRMLAPPPVPTGERDLLAETRRWAIEARSARLHKPHFFDAHDPFLAHVLAKQARAIGAGGSVLWHECLPEADGYGRADGPGGAEEFFVEFTIAGGRHAGC